MHARRDILSRVSGQYSSSTTFARIAQPSPAPWPYWTSASTISQNKRCQVEYLSTCISVSLSFPFPPRWVFSFACIDTSPWSSGHHQCSWQNDEHDGSEKYSSSTMFLHGWKTCYLPASWSEKRSYINLHKGNCQVFFNRNEFLVSYQCWPH